MKKFDVLVVGELNVDLIINKIQPFPEISAVATLVKDKLEIVKNNPYANEKY